MYSKTVRYSLRAILFLAANSDAEHLYKLNDIANYLQINPPILAVVLQKMARHHLIMSQKGRYGGFYMTDMQKQLHVCDVLKVSGDHTTLGTHCYLGLKICDGIAVCPFHPNVEEIRLQLNHIYDGQTLEWIGNKIYSTI